MVGTIDPLIEWDWSCPGRSEAPPVAIGILAHPGDAQNVQRNPAECGPMRGCGARSPKMRSFPETNLAEPIPTTAPATTSLS